MPGTAIEVDLKQLGFVISQVQRARLDLLDTDPLTNGIAALLENQTKRRIADEKEAPDGTAWAEWSPDYAATREPHHSLLIDTQNLLDSIAGQSSDGAATVGTDLVYGPAHQYGTDRIPARPFLGLSKDNADEINEAIKAWLEELL